MNRKHFLSSLLTLGAGTALPVLGAPARQVVKPVPPRVPDYLSTGDTIGITCPAGFITLKEIEPAIQQIESWGFKIKIGNTVDKRDFSFGGTDAERAADLQQMIDDPGLKAILCARGGYGAVRIVDRLDLEQENHSLISSSRSSHKDTLDSGYKRGFFAINGGWHFLGIVISIVFIGVTLTQPGKAYNWPQWYLTSPLGWLTVALAICALIANGIFGSLLRAPTVAGQSLMDHIRGFKMYLEVAEGEELKRIKGIPPKMTPELYEAYLPAALALEVEQRWAERFARELQVDPQTYQPAWYSGSAWNAANVANFSSQLGTSLSSAIASASQAPGSSSGGGGGGSSGGGGGGGGVGGW